MNVIAGVVGGVVGAVMALTVRLVLAHPVACVVGLGALIALAKGVPGPIVLGVRVVIAIACSGYRKTS